MLKLIALDLDGTLLNDHHNLTDYTISTIQRLSRRGIIILIATGRSTIDAQKYFRALDIKQEVFPCVSYNGSLGTIFSIINRDFLPTSVYTNNVFPNMSRKLVALAAEMGLVLQYYNSDTGDVYAVPLNDSHINLLQRYERLVGRAQIHVSDYEEVISVFSSPKILIMTNDPDSLIQKAKEIFVNNEFHIIRGSPEPFFVEFLSPGASKGSGTKLICDYMHIKAEEVTAFGDGDNDKELLEYAGIGIAVSNAKAAAKDAADIILQWSNDEDGVAKQLIEMEKQGLF